MEKQPRPTMKSDIVKRRKRLKALIYQRLSLVSFSAGHARILENLVFSRIFFFCVTICATVFDSFSCIFRQASIKRTVHRISYCFSSQIHRVFLAGFALFLFRRLFILCFLLNYNECATCKFHQAVLIQRTFCPIMGLREEIECDTLYISMIRQIS